MPPIPTRPSEEILNAPLPDLIRDLGLAVAAANKALRDPAVVPAPPGGVILYTIPEADIEVRVAITMNKSTDTSVGGSLGISVFSINASYKNTYGFSEEASSSIKIKVRALPPTP